MPAFYFVLGSAAQIGRSFFVVERIFVVKTLVLGYGARLGLAAVAGNEFRKAVEVDKLIGLAAQLIGDHRRARDNRADDADAHALALRGLKQAAEIAIAGKKDDMVDLVAHFHHVDGELDVDIALDLLAALRIDELLGGLRHHRVAIIIEPVDKRADRRVILILDEGGVIEGADQTAPLAGPAQQFPIINIETKGFCGSIKIGAVNKHRDLFVGIKKMFKAIA